MLALLLQTCGSVVIVLNFYLNRAYIAQNLCENKSKPQLNCCGKCQLNKKLQQQENKDQQNNNRREENRSEAFVPAFYSIVIFYPAATAIAWHLPASIGTPVDMPAGYFHPPSCPA